MGVCLYIGCPSVDVVLPFAIKFSGHGDGKTDRIEVRGRKAEMIFGCASIAEVLTILYLWRTEFMFIPSVGSMQGVAAFHHVIGQSRWHH